MTLSKLELGRVLKAAAHVLTEINIHTALLVFVPLALYYKANYTMIIVSVSYQVILYISAKHKIPLPAIRLFPLNPRQQALKFELCGQAHRENGPAVYSLDGTLAYKTLGFFHRIGGPALLIKDPPMDDIYFLFGSTYAYKFYNEIITGRSDIEIAAYLYVTTDRLGQTECIEEFLRYKGKADIIDNLRAARLLA